MLLATGNRLVANKGKSFQGSNVLGKGFILTPDQADDLIQRDPRNKDVLFPYLNGEDLNSRPDCSASRWVINFHDWSEEQARSYPEVFAIIERDVKPERLKVRHSKNARERWWLYERRRPELYSTIADMDRVLVVALVSRTVMPVTVPTGQVFSHMLGVFASPDLAHTALLGSGIHYVWAIARASSLKGDLRYTPSDVYETLPLPAATLRMEDSGRALDGLRREIMTERKIGLTSLYKIVHDPRDLSNEIQAFRETHREVDEATADAYGWCDLKLDHGFQRTRQGIRFLISPAAASEMVDRLLELNHIQRENEAQSKTSRSRATEKATRRTTEGDVLF
ncbi:type IIL restriction-modification enzyme MmeI [Streptomyces sp. NPDC058420]|uniref:type IIL restriction-modification enzyme MmeI n=1 Tax=Streptomyces sp. NPDC058420 TaxID=3346489 RepID=UPI0036495582